MELKKKITGTKVRKRTIAIHHSAAKGFTLVEIMIVVVIISVIALFAAPSMVDFGPNMRVKAAARDLHNNLQKMKVEAIKRNRDVIMNFTLVACGTQGGSYQIFIDDDSSGAQNGAEEWLSFSDGGVDPAPDIDYDMPQNTGLCNSTFAGTTMGFNSSGMVLNNNNGIFTVQNDRGLTYLVTVLVAGAITTQ